MKNLLNKWHPVLGALPNQHKSHQCLSSTCLKFPLTNEPVRCVLVWVHRLIVKGSYVASNNTQSAFLEASSLSYEQRSNQLAAIETITFQLLAMEVRRVIWPTSTLSSLVLWVIVSHFVVSCLFVVQWSPNNFPLWRLIYQSVLLL